jgi:hypothetical protein
MEALTRQLEAEQKMTSKRAHDRAWEMIREKCILLPLQCAFLADKIRLSFEESRYRFGILQKTNMPMAAPNMSKVAMATQVTASDELG